MSVEDVAEHLGIAGDRVYPWTEDEAPAGAQYRSSLKASVSDVDDWVRSDGASETEADG